MRSKWTAVGVVSVVLAAILLVAYADRRRVDVHSGDVGPFPVLVAKRLIAKGTPASLIVSQTDKGGTPLMYAATTLPPKELKDGAIADPSYLNGRAAAVDILPGEQIIASDFTWIGPAPMTVLVATQPILKGTPGSIVVAKGMYRPTVTPPQQREVGAISDPSYLTDRVSVAEIHLGQQLTEANFPARG